MVADDVDRPEAGFKLDALVGVKVMKFPVFLPGREGASPRQPPAFPYLAIAPDKSLRLWRSPDASTPWMPSVDIAQAWEVVERIRRLAACHLFFDRQGFMLQVDEIGGSSGGPILETAPSAPLAICRAALKTAQRLKW